MFKNIDYFYINDNNDDGINNKQCKSLKIIRISNNCVFGCA